MIVIGLGSDLVNITRIEATLERYGTRFIQRAFTETEQRMAEGRAMRAATYAKRFAAKEACSKALGTGLFRDAVFLRDIGVVNLPNGAPTLELTGGAKARLDAMMPPGTVPRIFLTITDEPPLAQAFVMITAVPVAT